MNAKSKEVKKRNGGKAFVRTVRFCEICRRELKEFIEPGDICPVCNAAVMAIAALEVCAHLDIGIMGRLMNRVNQKVN